MKQYLVTFGAATIAALAFAAPTPSVAQGVAVEVPGVGVRIGEPDRRPVAREERHDRVLEEREVRGSRNCRTVTVQEDTATGSRSKTKQECD